MEDQNLNLNKVVTNNDDNNNNNNNNNDNNNNNNHHNNNNESNNNSKNNYINSNNHYYNYDNKYKNNDNCDLDDRNNICSRKKEFENCLIFQMKDSTNMPVKFEFHNSRQFQNLSDQFTEDNISITSNTIQIFFKSVNVKNVFGDCVTGIKSGKESDFVILKCRHLDSNQVNKNFDTFYYLFLSH